MANGAVPDIGYGKVGAAAVAGAASTVIIFILKKAGIDIGDIESAIQTLLTAFAVYFTPHKFA
jgi:hypothetical protein